MAQLEGQEREDYRNAQYQMLVQRAKQQGYDMPATPPWQAATEPNSTVSQTPVSEAAMSSSAATASDTAAAHAAMREKMRAHREALLQAANTPAPAVDVPTVAASSETVEPTASSTAEPASPIQSTQPAVNPVTPAAPPPVSQRRHRRPIPRQSLQPPLTTHLMPRSSSLPPVARAQPPAGPTAPQPPVAPTPPMQSAASQTVPRQ